MSTETTKPWERQPGEPLKAYEHFQYWLSHTYVNKKAGHKHPTRSLEGVARDLGFKHATVLNRYSRDWGWPDRARAYDNHLMQTKVRDQEERIREMNERHISMSKLVQSLAEAEAKRLLRMVESEVGLDAEGNPVPTLDKPLDVAKLMDLSAKLERLALGEATDRTQQVDDLDLSQLSDQELEQLALLREKARRR